MTDLHFLLTNAAHSPGAPPPPDNVIEADISRGRRALRGTGLAVSAPGL